MRLGINIGYRDKQGRPLDIPGIVLRARRIEDVGFDAIWQPDTLSREVQPRPDALAYLTIAAGATSRVLLGTAVYIVTFRHPLDLAQRAMTLQLLSHGRLQLGVGAGSDAVALELGAVAYEERFKRLHESVAIVRALLAGEEVGDAAFHPWPEMGEPPRLLLGSWGSEISLRRAVRDYDGWICSAGRTSLNVMKDAIARYRDKGGGRAVVATCPVDLTAPYQPLDPDGPFHLRCPPEAAAERLRLLVELGFDDVGLQKVDATSKRWEADATEEELREIRALLPPAE